MPDHTAQTSPAKDDQPDQGRRDFLLLLPLSIYAGMLATIVIAALRFLGHSGSTAEALWTDVAPASQLKGDQPIMRSIIVERRAGWASMLEEHYVYVLPKQNNQVLSSICPHQGCNVMWRDDAGVFSCPCHDSHFAADGTRIDGPARRGLDPLPSRERDGVLQVQYLSFVNNIEQRVVRG